MSAIIKLELPDGLDTYFLLSLGPMYMKQLGKAVMQQHTSSDRIRYCYKLLEEANFLPTKIDDDCKKDERKAILAKERGNEFFMAKEYTKALQCYNEALCLAPAGTECLAIGYANRSAIYFDTGYFKFCLENIELALQNNYPERLKSKLLLRKEACIKRMETQNSCGSPEELKLTYPANPKIPFIVDSLYCKTHAVRGRGIYTNRKLIPGDIIVIEEPYQVIVQHNGYYSNCNYCHSMNFLNLKPCPLSTTAMFCSDKCAQDAWNQYHKYEYSVVHELTDLMPKGFGFLHVRAALNVMTQFESSSDLQELIDSIDVKTENAFDIDFPTADERSKFRALYALQSQKKDLETPEAIFTLSCILASAWHIFKEFTQMKEALKSREFEDLFLNLMNKFFGTCCVNHHSLYKTLRADIYGSGISLVNSLINHSCAPNVSRRTGPRKEVIVVIRPIKAGAELFSSYTYRFQSTPLEIRQNYLSLTYGFKCKCEACYHDYPMGGKLPPKSLKLKPLIMRIYTPAHVDTLKSQVQCHIEKEILCRALAGETQNYPSRETFCLEIGIVVIIDRLIQFQTFEDIPKDIRSN